MFPDKINCVTLHLVGYLLEYKSQVLILQKSVKELGTHLGLHPAEGQLKVTINACCPKNIKIVKAYSGMKYLLLEIYAKLWSRLQAVQKADRGRLFKGLEHRV
jgi:hypothetical protein